MASPRSWHLYTDTTFAFRISYPPGFTFKQEGGADPASGWLMAYRAVDSRYLCGYPPGQVEIGIFNKDADTLTAWVHKHSDSTCGLPNGTGFFWGVTDLGTVTAAGRDAVTFDDSTTGCSPQAIRHNTVFFLGSGRVFAFDWYSMDSIYTPTISSIAQQMLATFNG